MDKEVVQCVQGCGICARYNVTQKGVSPAKRWEFPSRPFHTVSVDLAGPLPRTGRRNEYILVVVDLLTHFVIAEPITVASTKKVYDAMIRNVFNLFGLPERILSDNGGQFTSELAKLFEKENGIGRMFVARYKPSTNGVVERTNRWIKGDIAKFVDGNRGRWDILLPAVVASRNRQVHSALGTSPAHALLGYQPKTILDLNLPVGGEVGVRGSNFVTEQRERIKYIRDTARANAERKGLRWVLSENDRRGRITHYEPGDRVLVKKFAFGQGRGRKLEPKYEGPWVVVKQYRTEGTYLLRDEDGVEKVHNVINIKPAERDEGASDERSDDEGQKVVEVVGGDEGVAESKRDPPQHSPPPLRATAEGAEEEERTVRRPRRSRRRRRKVARLTYSDEREKK